MNIDELTDDITTTYCELYDDENDISTDKIKKLSGATERLNNLLRKRLKTTEQKSTNKNSVCYVCKTKLTNEQTIHKLNNNMCSTCVDINYKKRTVTCDLTGKIAIITGGRVKIGYETSKKLLLSGCTVIVTSRFVDDCLSRYQKEEKYDEFKSRLTIYQLNMLNYNKVCEFIKYIHKKFTKIDILINNAAQTIKRPYKFYEHMLTNRIDTSKDDENNIVARDDNDCKYLKDNNNKNNNLTFNNGTNNCDKNDIYECTRIDDFEKIFPIDKYDEFGQQIDLRKVNSWILEIDDVDVKELLEVYCINTIIPFVLCGAFKNLMKRDKDEYTWIVNVSSMEGVFNWRNKPSTHPHTNMAKAGLNMMTRTCGKYYIKENIVMISVDTGWNNSQYPCTYDIKTPLDCIDGASRILYPIYKKIIRHSVLYKNYVVNDW